MTVEGTNKVYDKAVKESAEKTEKIKDMFENLGFERDKVKTLYFNVEAEFGRNDLKTIDIPTEQKLNFRLITK